MESKQISRHSVTAMFDRISSTYDRLNKVLSFGIDQSWRKKIRAYITKNKEQTLVDLATGTGDQILALASHPNITRMIGFDLSQKMLAIGKAKVAKLDNCELRLGSALDIPLPDESADSVTISFGIRNVTDPILCLSEMHRILKPSGRAFVLEFSKPNSSVIRFFYFFYLRHILPKIGKLLSKDHAAYTYLNQTIEEFPSGKEFRSMMESAGFDQVIAKPLCFGAVTLYVGDKS